jgi:hypothetical protein
VRSTTETTIKRMRVYPDNDFILPEVRCLSPVDFENNGNYQLDLKSSDNSTLQVKLLEFQDTILAMANGTGCLHEWTNEKQFVPCIKSIERLSDGSPIPTMSLFNVKLQHWQNIPKFELFDARSKKLLYGKYNKQKDLEPLLPKNSSITPIIRCNGIWVNESKWGISFSLIQALIEPAMETMKGKWIGFEDEDD